MSDTGAHPGVRSLLAKFENNQNTTTSPPSRGRSPVGSENSGAGRPLSKVRASFIAVDGAVQSNPVVGLRKASGGSDSPAGPSRVKTFNSDDSGSLKSPLSLSPISNSFPESSANGNDSKNSISKELPGASTGAPMGSAEESTKPVIKETVPSHNKENHSVAESAASTSPAVQSVKPTNTVTKRPSTIHIAKASTASKPTSGSTSVTGPRSSTKPRTPTSPAMTENNKAKATRTAKTATAGDHRVPTQKPSRTSLTTAVRTASRPPRSSMPSREPTRPTVSGTKPRSNSPSRSARLPASATAPTLSSSGKLGATGTTTSRLTRKPSTLKPAAGANQRATTPTASNVRKHASRPSPPGHSGSERPHSRVSQGGSKPVDEGFLARMMRPTASSASKTHDKVEAKSPPRSTKTARAPVQKVVPKTEPRAPRPTKETSKSVKRGEETTAENPNEEPQKSAKQHTSEDVTQAPSEPQVDEKTVDAEAKRAAEEPVEATLEKPSTDAPIDSSVPQPSEVPVDAEAPAEPKPEVSVEQPTEASIEQTINAVQSTTVEPVAPTEPVDAPTPSDTPECHPSAEVRESVESAPPVQTEAEPTPENAAETSDPTTESKPIEDDVDADIGKLSLN
ncbi:hypothetical protein EYZ11_011559 [Aspergillus tanneri]|uniref:Mucin-7 n=1 Tax=Aspergillus tanneri TaxID=1220188 RepID=A0A4S3J342_9EURO|nr:uncharacterized protein ATNIH1004_006113 [Aspergillus tanneri]KAA8647420.1 hypothetical protein ATNIH1004_006113 [Aspergillus tanneri]THC88992.1 hypothetical protein EYZ11_011559 [Aspergillus tanneri]